MSSKAKKHKKAATPKFTPRVLSCEKCGAAFFDESKFQEHQKLHEDKVADASSKKLFLCEQPLCNTLCVDQESYVKHMQMHGIVKSEIGVGGREGMDGRIKVPSGEGTSNQDRKEQMASAGLKRKREIKVEPGMPPLMTSTATSMMDISGQRKKKGGIAIGSVIHNKIAKRKRQKLAVPAAKPKLMLPDNVHQVICPHCNIQMFAPMSLCMAHIRTHGNGIGDMSKKSADPFVCMYKNNILSEYSKKKALVFACTDCTEQFNSYEKLSKHAKTHVKLKGPSASKRVVSSPRTQPKDSSQGNFNQEQSTHHQGFKTPQNVRQEEYQGVGSIIDYAQQAIEGGLIEKTLSTSAPLEQSPNEVIEIKEEAPSSEPQPERAETSTTLDKHHQSLAPVYTCQDASCTFRTHSSWEYQLHKSNIHPLPAASSSLPTSSSSTENAWPVVLNIPNVGYRTFHPPVGSSVQGQDHPQVAGISSESSPPNSATLQNMASSVMQAPRNMFQCNVCKGYL